MSRLKGTVARYNDENIILKSESGYEYVAEIKRTLAPPEIGQYVTFEVDESRDRSKKTNLRFAKDIVSETKNNILKLCDFDVSKLKVAKCNSEVPLASKKKEIVENDIAAYEKNNNISVLRTDINSNHFVVVFNPLFNTLEEASHEKYSEGTQAHWFYHLLRDNIENTTSKYSYWGKLKSFEDPLTISNYRETITRNSSSKKATNLYISDFTFLWVAKVVEVYEKLPKSEIEKTLYFYQKNDERVEIWFKVTDLVLLSSTARETCEHMGKLKLQDAKDSDSYSLNPYLCNLRYPLLVRADEGEKHFEFDDTNILITKGDNPFVNSPSLEAKLKEAVNSYVIPEFIFQKIPLEARNQILMAEALFLQKDDNSGRHLKVSRERQIFLHYAMALESIFKDITCQNSRRIDYSLGNFHYDLCEWKIKRTSIWEEVFNKSQGLSSYLSSKDFENFLKITTELRNDVVHLDKAITEEVAAPFVKNFRSVMIGLGCLGIINSIYSRLYPEEVKKFAPHFEHLINPDLLTMAHNAKERKAS